MTQEMKEAAKNEARIVAHNTPGASQNTASGTAIYLAAYLAAYKAAVREMTK